MNKYTVTVRHEFPGECESIQVVEAENEWRATIKAIQKASKMPEMQAAGKLEDMKIWIVERREKTWQEKMAESL